MTATVEELQADLSKFLERAPNGDEVLITQDGRAVAKLIILPQSPALPIRHEWLQGLAKLRQETATHQSSPTTDEILDELRSDRG